MQNGQKDLARERERERESESEREREREREREIVYSSRQIWQGATEKMGEEQWNCEIFERY